MFNDLNELFLFTCLFVFSLAGVVSAIVGPPIFFWWLLFC